MRIRLVVVVSLAAACLMALASVHADQARARGGGGSSATVPAWDGTEPLHWAAYKQDAAVVAQLLRKGADPNARNNYGVTPLSGTAVRDVNRSLVGELSSAAPPLLRIPRY